MEHISGHKHYNGASISIRGELLMQISPFSFILLCFVILRSFFLHYYIMMSAIQLPLSTETHFHP
jgi:hypothetical protein